MDPKPLLVFDLDGTLIYATRAPPPHYDFAFTLQNITFYIRKRPGLDDFLQWCRQHFKLAVWSAGSPDYVQAIVKELFPKDDLAFVFTAEQTSRCVYDQGREVIHRKYLRKAWLHLNWVWNYSNTRILDDNPDTYTGNVSNALEIESWSGDDKDDSELTWIMCNLNHFKAACAIKLTPLEEVSLERNDGRLIPITSSGE